MTYKMFLLALTFTCISCSPLHAAAPDITADAAVIMDGSDGRFLYEKNGTKREYPASMTKIMTCILSLEKGDTYQTVTVSPRAADVESTALNGGEWLSLGDLRNQMMMISDNGRIFRHGHCGKYGRQSSGLCGYDEPESKGYRHDRHPFRQRQRHA